MDVLDVLENLATAQPLDYESEADTRARAIDPLLEALGWTQGGIRREPHAGWHGKGGYLDYLLSTDGRVRYVIEAKKRGRTFDIPSNLRKQKHTSYKKLFSSGSPDLQEALTQCIQYSQQTGAPYAAATNGTDWVFFKPSHPYRALPDARVVLFSGLDDIRGRLDEFQRLLSREGVEQGQNETLLLGKELRVPAFSKKLRELFPYGHGSSIEEEDYNHILADLIEPLMRNKMIDITEEDDLRECYVPVHGNFSTAATIGAAILSRARSTPDRQKHVDFATTVVRPPTISPSTGRTLVLHGGMGVGKTTFLRNCERELREKGSLQETVWARVDLLPFRDRPFQIAQVDAILALISQEIQDALIAATEGMPGNHSPQDWVHLRDIYNTEARQFQRARYPGASDADPVYMEALRKHVWDICQRDPQEHLLRTVRWLTSHKLPVILVLDNSDQLGLEFQEYLHKLSHSIQSRTGAVTILVLRTEALASHRIREHAIASVDEYFQVIPAPFSTVLKKRFERIQATLLELNGSDLTPSVRDMTTVAAERLSTLMDTIESEAANGTEAYQILHAAGNGSLRDALRGVAALFRASPKLMDSMVVAEHRDGQARLNKERVLRALMKEDMRGLESHRLVPNIFVTEKGLYVPYSLALRLLQQIASRSTIGDYNVSNVLNDFAVAGIDRALCARTLLRLRRERLVSVPHMLTEMREDDSVSVTLLGAATDIFLQCKDYYSWMAFESYIYSSEIFYLMRDAWSSFDPYSVKLDKIGRYFSRLVQQVDNEFRNEVDFGQLEPVASTDFPTPSGWKREE